MFNLNEIGNKYVYSEKISPDLSREKFKMPSWKSTPDTRMSKNDIAAKYNKERIEKERVGLFNSSPEIAPIKLL